MPLEKYTKLEQDSDPATEIGRCRMSWGGAAARQQWIRGNICIVRPDVLQRSGGKATIHPVKSRLRTATGETAPIQGTSNQLAPTTLCTRCGWQR